MTRVHLSVASSKVPWLRWFWSGTSLATWMMNRLTTARQHEHPKSGVAIIIRRES